MAIGNPTVRTTVNEKNSTNPFVGAIETQIDIDEYAIAIVATDNLGGTGGTNSFSERGFMSDTQGNEWVRVSEYTDEASSLGGSAVHVFVSKITETLTTSDTFTVRFYHNPGSRALGAKGAVIIAGSTTAGKRLLWESTIDGSSHASGDPTSRSLASLTSREHLFLRAIAYQAPDAVVLTPTANFTAVGGNGSGSGTTGGASNSNNTALAEWDIAAASTGSTSDPATDVDGAHASTFVAFYEEDAWEGPTYIGSGASAESQTTATPGLPVGWQENDIFVMICESHVNEAVTCTGWAEIDDSPQQSSATRLTILWKRATSSESAPTTNDPGNHILAVIHGFRGCPTTGDPWNVTAGDSETSDTSIEIPGATTTVDNCKVLAVTTRESDAEDTWLATPGFFTNADLLALQTVYDWGTTEGSGGMMAAAVGEKVAAGAYADTTATTGGTTDARISIAFYAAPAGQLAEYGVATETDTALDVVGFLPFFVDDNFDHAMSGYDSTTGTPSIVSSPVRSGSGALELNPTAAAENVEYNAPTGSRRITVSFYFRVPAAPAAAVRLAMIVGPSDTMKVWLENDGTISVGDSDGSVIGPSIDDDEWHLFDGVWDVSGSTATVDWAIDEVAQTQATLVEPAADITAVRLGTANASTFTAYYEDWLATLDPNAYPIGPHGGLDQIENYGVAAETDAALAFAHSRLAGYGLASETDAALAFFADRLIAYGVALETDEALVFTGQIGNPERIGLYGVAAETDEALAFLADRLHLYGVAGETDSGLSFVHSKLVSYGVAVETDAALALIASKLAQYGAAAETDEALEFLTSLETPIFYGVATETDEALAFVHSKLVEYGIAGEFDLARQFTGAHLLPIVAPYGPAVEIEQALSFEAETARVLEAAEARFSPFSLRPYRRRSYLSNNRQGRY